MPKINNMTDKEVSEALKENTPLNRARQVFSSACAQIEQACQQRTPLSIFDERRMEFQAVEGMLEAMGVTLEQVEELAQANKSTLSPR